MCFGPGNAEVAVPPDLRFVGKLVTEGRDVPVCKKWFVIEPDEADHLKRLTLRLLDHEPYERERSTSYINVRSEGLDPPSRGSNIVSGGKGGDVNITKDIRADKAPVIITGGKGGDVNVPDNP